MDSKRLAERANRKGAVQKVKELSSLISLLKRRRLRTIVEIGTAKGGTFYAWCKIAEPDAAIISIDLPGGPFGGGYSIRDIKKFRGYGRKRQRLYFLRKDSQKRETVDQVIKIIKGRGIDFLFIDGDHRYSGVKKDWNLYSPLVKRHGVIVFHDILFHPEVRSCKVDKFWKEIKRNYRHREFIYKKDDRGWGQWGGIGIIYFQPRG
jgi:predicted O-methyltransferase YrrM